MTWGWPLYLCGKKTKTNNGVRAGGRVGGRGVGAFHSVSLWSDRGLDSRLFYPLSDSGSLSPAPLRLSCLQLFVPVNSHFVLPFSLSVRAGETALRHRLALSHLLHPSPPLSRILPHYRHNNSIHFSLFIQPWQGRAILMVGVKAYIRDIKHTHTRHSKCWSWQIVTITHRLNKRFVWQWPLGAYQLNITILNLYLM